MLSGAIPSTWSSTDYVPVVLGELMERSSVLYDSPAIVYVHTGSFTLSQKYITRAYMSLTAFYINTAKDNEY